MMRYGVLIHGTNETTGFGKSTLALCLARDYAVMYNRTFDLPKSDALVVFSQTLDSLRGIRFKKGMILVLDEFSPSDADQIQYLSEQGLKTLMDPRMPASLRARNNNVELPPGVPRLFTSNCETPAEWCGKRIPWSPPLQRKTVCFNITRPLCTPGWATETDIPSDDESAVFEGMSALFPPTVQNTTVAVPEPPALVSRMGTMLRGLFRGVASFMEPGRTVNHNGHLVTI
jgi:hypothetical protein